ncbi:MAG: hypothetical protein U0133_18605 [Gemmatimonadales bacterium]
MPNAKTCRYCNRPLSLLEEKAGVCLAAACRMRAYQADAQARARVRDAEISGLVQLGHARRQVPDPESYPVTTLPAQHRALGPLPAVRKRAFAAHLDNLLAGIEGPSSIRTIVAHDLTPQMERLSVQGCIGCKGYCCQTASTHAWLTVSDVQRIREAAGNPGVKAFRAAYLRHLTGRRYIDSCVFHGEQGCVLPREMRSDLCNTYWCGELRGLHRSQADAPAPRALMIWPGADGTMSAAFADPDRSIPVE